MDVEVREEVKVQEERQVVNIVGEVIVGDQIFVSLLYFEDVMIAIIFCAWSNNAVCKHFRS